MPQTTHYGGMMEKMRESWTDERIDDLSGGLAEFRSEMKDELRAVRREMNEEFSAVRREMKGEFSAVRIEAKEEFGSLHARFDGLQQTMIQLGGLVIAALIGLIATQL
jgi:hypothetical protein